MSDRGPAKRRAIVAGHICLDIFPFFENPPDDPRKLFAPGHLFPIESTLFSTGGAVANTGGGLHALGIETYLVARVGPDGFGNQIASILSSRHPKESIALKVVPDGGTSYSIILSSPSFDRIFFHSSGVNDTFVSTDLGPEMFAGRDLLHFGYPPAMEGMYREEGRELVDLFSRAKAAGLTTSLDLSPPQPGSKSAGADWKRILERALPSVDLFLPSFDELHLMLQDLPAGEVDLPRLRELSEWVLSHDCAVCALKIGADGLYVRTTENSKRIERMGRCAPGTPEAWAGRELIEPCFEVDALGTTGAGDATIAGFLASVLRGLSLEEATRMALAAGAASVENVESASSLPEWEALSARVSAGWQRARTTLSLQPGG